MPTPTGLPKTGEIWRRTFKLPPDWKEQHIDFVVISRGRGDYWPMHVAVIVEQNGNKYLERKLWVDPANWFRLGELRYTGVDAGPKTKRALGIG